MSITETHAMLSKQGHHEPSHAFASTLNPVPGPHRDVWKMTVLDLFSENVRQFPNSIALVDGERSISYAELWNFADAFRARLVARGIDSGDVVGITSRRSAAHVAAILGIVMAGGCYMPIDTAEFSAQVLEEIGKSSGVRAWIADAKASESVSPSVWEGCSVLSLEDVSRPSGTRLAEIPELTIGGNSPLYVMFTSGSTGIPKGVVVPHRAVARLVVDQEFIHFGPDETFLLHSPLSFDASTLELWGSLLHGSRLVLAPDKSLGLDDYARILLEQGVTTLWLTAAMFHLAAEHAPELFAPLRQLLFGGDVISPRYVERVRELYPTLHMVNGYGPTENTTFTCCYCVPPDYRADGTLPIGSAIAHTTVYILDADRKELPVGQEGELAAGGAGVALGYLGRPEATAERFVADAFSTKPGAMLYLTGDRARQRHDGSIEFLGRMDRQIKIAGHRVELAAIEMALSASPLVADAAVVVLTIPSGEKRMVACVASTNPVQDAEATLRAWLQARLSRASIPQEWLFLDKLPINANGKLDRSALQRICETRLHALGHSTPAVQAENAASEAAVHALDETATTLDLQQMWAKLLGRAAVGADENFFDLGGTSLLLIEMHVRLKVQFASVPSLVDMFAFPTPSTLAARLVAGGPSKEPVQTAELRGQRQRAAMLARRPAMHAVRTAPQNTAIEDGRR
ncbi:MAG: non-ribosomal peptide synthetase [Acidobacteriaceae bacterium]